jgi:hypothetical protein
VALEALWDPQLERRGGSTLEGGDGFVSPLFYPPFHPERLRKEFPFSVLALALSYLILVEAITPPLSPTVCRPKTSDSAHLRKLESRLEPKPEKNQGDFSRAIEAFSGQMMECYWVISQLALCSPYLEMKSPRVALLHRHDTSSNFSYNLQGDFAVGLGCIACHLI